MRHLLACGKARLRVFKPVLSCLERWGGESGNSRDKTDETSCLLLGRNRPACVSRGQTIPKACAALALAHAGAVSLPLARVLSLPPSFSLSVSLFLSLSLSESYVRGCVNVCNSVPRTRVGNHTKRLANHDGFSSNVSVDIKNVLDRRAESLFRAMMTTGFAC